MRNLIEMDMEIKERLTSCDKRWPIEIMLNNSEKGYKEYKVWIEQFYINWTIADHPRRLAEIMNPNDSDYKNIDYPEKVALVLIEEYGVYKLQEFGKRVLILQPYNYSQEDLTKFDEYCKGHNLKYERRWISPYYIGTKLIIVYEDDNDVEEFVRKLLKIQDEEFGKDCYEKEE